MNKNYLTLTLGGKELGIKLRNRTIDLIGEISGIDPLELRPAPGWAGLKEYVCIILHAGLLSNVELNKEQPDFTAENVRQWMADLSPQEIYLIADVYRNFMNPSILTANGEVSTDTRGEQASNVA